MNSNGTTFRHAGKWQVTIGATMLLCAAPALCGSVTAKVTDTSGNPVGDAIVYAVPKGGTRVPTPSPRQVSIEQIDREFVPYVTVVQLGTTVNFPNRDPLLHHVYSFSPAKSFEIKLYSRDASRTILLDKPGMVTLGCNIHDWMIGYILVVETPYFGKTGSDGVARLGEVIAGEFDVHAWHPAQRAQVGVNPVKIDARTRLEIELAIDVAPRKKRFKPPGDGMRYP
jgi:plastocyanin